MNRSCTSYIECPDDFLQATGSESVDLKTTAPTSRISPLNPIAELSSPAPSSKCLNSIDCPGSDDPIINFSSEANDGPTYLRRGLVFCTDCSWMASRCNSWFISSDSYADAVYQANIAAFVCMESSPNGTSSKNANGHGGHSTIPIFYNKPQKCHSSTCTDKAGTFVSHNQATADAAALADACRKQPNIRVENSEQTATVHPECPCTTSATVPAGTYVDYVCSQDEVSAMQSQLDAQAYSQAYSEAYAHYAHCYGNAVQYATSTQPCPPTGPDQTTTAGTPACTFTSDNPADVPSLNATASAAALAQAKYDARLKCPCSYSLTDPSTPTIPGEGVFTNKSNCVILLANSIQGTVYQVHPGQTLDTYATTADFYISGGTHGNFSVTWQVVGAPALHWIVNFFWPNL